MNTKYNIWIFVAVIILLPAAAFGIVKWYENNYTSLPVLGPPNHVLSDFSLTNQNGKSRSLKNEEGKITVNNFFFTHCPTICPKMIWNIKTVQAIFKNDEDVLFNSFTVDPQRDSVAQLKQYALRLGIDNNWQLLTGDKKEIYKLARKSFLVVATDGDGGPNDFIHSDLLVLVDKQKKIRGYYKGTDEEAIKNLERDIKRLEQLKN